ncbi:MAG: cysteine desulfurase [Pirellulales bacterium]|nr:cysteine desulfurase [Pirellulales bacterium]
MLYLDNHATTRADPRVVAEMLPYFSDQYGNSGSSGHRFGEAAHVAVEQARSQIAACLGAQAEEIVFTSGATESNNLAIRGVAQRQRRRGNHLVSVRSEHPAVLEPLASLARHKYEVTLLDIEAHPRPQAGRLDPQQVAAALRDDTLLVSVMLANNEIGVIQPLLEIGALCRQRDVLLHCDATQAVGKIPIDLKQLPVDLMSFSAHKIYGPKGVGGLFVRGANPRVRLEPQIRGGGQEAARRSGTLNAPGIVGLAKALAICVDEMPAESRRLTTLRDRLWEGLGQELGELQLCGPALDARDNQGQPLRLPGNLNLSFGDVDGEALVMAMGDLAVSSGATCASTHPGPSHVLLALGMGEDLARSSLRFGLGRFNSETDVDQAIEIVSSAVKKLRKLASS